ncbi:MAG: hypothetical protein Q4C36_00860 [Coriobacteriia bacterium]|nr:hypothetical protein [Coriobacteriia bacterium]
MNNPGGMQRDALPHAADAESPAPRLILESLRVRRDRVIATVRVGNPEFATTTPQLARQLVRIRPDLPIHSCVNGRGPTFGAVIANTPIPHVLEHVVIDLQTAVCTNPDRVFTGVTRWIDRRAGRAQVEVSYADDLVCLRAFRDAVELLNSL